MATLTASRKRELRRELETIKHAFNPTGLCNPGKVFPTRKSHAIEEKGLAQRF
jgi:hypothetical protein